MMSGGEIVLSAISFMVGIILADLAHNKSIDWECPCYIAVFTACLVGICCLK